MGSIIERAHWNYARGIRYRPSLCNASRIDKIALDLNKLEETKSKRIKKTLGGKAKRHITGRLRGYVWLCEVPIMQLSANHSGKAAFS
jgi:hypothetical protein